MELSTATELGRLPKQLRTPMRNDLFDSTLSVISLTVPTKNPMPKK